MPSALDPQKRAEARSLVERDGVSLAEAARRLGVGVSTVRRWQKANEQDGDGWRFAGSPTARAAAGELHPAPRRTAEQNRELTERARAATAHRWQLRQQDAADGFGEAAVQARQMAMALAAQAVRASQATMGDLPDGSVALSHARAKAAGEWAKAARNLAVISGIFADKAQVLTGGETDRVGVLGIPENAREAAVSAIQAWRARRE
jgi:transposase-like protein